MSGSAWPPTKRIQEVISGFTDMTWPEACLKIIRRFHALVTPDELRDSYKNCKQLDQSDEDYIVHMEVKARGLSGTLSKKDALRYTVANLKESRIRLPLEDKVNEGEISTFSDLFKWAVEFNQRYVGSSGTDSQDKGKDHTQQYPPCQLSQARPQQYQNSQSPNQHPRPTHSQVLHQNQSLPAGPSQHANFQQILQNPARQQQQPNQAPRGAIQGDSPYEQLQRHASTQQDPPICYTCHLQGHLARDLPSKHPYAAAVCGN